MFLWNYTSARFNSVIAVVVLRVVFVVFTVVVVEVVVIVSRVDAIVFQNVLVLTSLVFV